MYIYIYIYIHIYTYTYIHISVRIFVFFVRFVLQMLRPRTLNVAGPSLSLSLSIDSCHLRHCSRVYEEDWTVSGGLASSLLEGLPEGPKKASIEKY